MANIVLSILGNAEGANRAVKSAESSVDGLKEHAHGAGSVMAGVFGGGVLLEGAEKLKEGVTESVDKLGELADETRTLQRVMGGSAEQVSGFIAVGDRFGVTSQQMAAGIGIADKAIVTGKDHFAAYGIATRDGQGHLLSMADMMPDIVEKISAIKNPTEQAAAAQELFGKGGKAMLPILTMGKERFDEYQESAKKAGTVIGGDAMNASFKYQQAQKELGEAVEGAQVKIGEKLYPTLINLTEWVTKNVIPAFQGMLSWLGQNKDIIGPIAAVIGVLAGVILTVVGALKVWAVVQEVLDLILDANPVGIVVMAIAALIAIIVLLVTHWKQVTHFLQTVWAAVCDWFAGTLRLLGTAWRLMWGGIAAFFRNIWNGITGFLTTAWTNAMNFLTGIPRRIMSLFAGAGGWLLDAGRNIINGLLSGAGQLLPNIGRFFLNLLPGWIQGPFKLALGIQSPSRVFAEHGGNIVQGLVNGITRGQSAVQSAVTSLVPTMSYAGMGVAGAAGSATTVAGHAAGGMHIEHFHAHENHSPYEIAQELGFMSRMG